MTLFGIDTSFTMMPPIPIKTPPGFWGRKLRVICPVVSKPKPPNDSRVVYPLCFLCDLDIFHHQPSTVWSPSPLAPSFDLIDCYLDLINSVLLINDFSSQSPTASPTTSLVPNPCLDVRTSPLLAHRYKPVWHLSSPSTTVSAPHICTAS